MSGKCAERKCVPAVWVPTLFQHSASVPWLHHSLLPRLEESLPLHDTWRDWDRPFLPYIYPAGGTCSCTVPLWLHFQVKRVHCDSTCHGAWLFPLPNGPLSPGAVQLRSCASGVHSRRLPVPKIVYGGPPGPPDTEPGWLAVQIGPLLVGPSGQLCLQLFGWAQTESPSAAASGVKSHLTSDTPERKREKREMEIKQIISQGRLKMTFWICKMFSSL